MSEEDKKGFTVTDRRVASTDESGDGPETKKKDQNVSPEEYEKLPEMNFASFVISLNTSALINLGLLPDLGTGEITKNKELAKQTIDLLGILKEKTKDNLNREEQDLLDNLLYDLRLKYIDLCK